ncbi:SIMPL domain-containing protein [Tomitella biformata]|uniref:SIMPL domain-containing protein n=1 Tax=Tomitella biformata TaxID=630403 RepID=UPI000467A677|nr:SIMPL domain-containing protein [Tomitella biformata]
MNKRASAALILSATTALLIAGCSSSPDTSSDSTPVGISTMGTGMVTGTPDTVTVVLGVQTQGSAAEGALAENARLASGLIETIKAKGVQDDDIQTSNLSVSPNYDSASGKVSGYSVTNQVTATMHDVSKAGDLIDAAAGAAGDAIRVQQLTFSIADDSDLRTQARTQAVKQAQDQARQIADAAGVELGDIRSITEDHTSSAQPFPQSMGRADMASATPIEAGSQQLSVSVAVVYEID